MIDKDHIEEFAAGVEKAEEVLKFCEIKAEAGEMNFEVEIPKSYSPGYTFAAGIESALEEKGFSVSIDCKDISLHAYINWSDTEPGTDADLLRQKAREASSYIKRVVKDIQWNYVVKAVNGKKRKVCYNMSPVYPQANARIVKHLEIAGYEPQWIKDMVVINL